MNIFCHEFRKYLRGTLFWTVALIGIAAVYLFFYPVIQQDLAIYSEFLNHYPKGLREAMGIYTDTFSTALGYYSFAYTMILLFASIQAGHAGLTILSCEEREKTADFLLTKPISRINIVSSKILAAFSLLAITWLLYSFSAYLLLRVTSGEVFSTRTYCIYCLGILFVQTIFFSLGLAVSTFLRKIRTVLPISLGMSFFFYAISAFAVTSESDVLRFFTPFEFVKAKDILADQAIQPSYLMIGLIAIIICIATSYYRYVRKDVHSV